MDDQRSCKRNRNRSRNEAATNDFIRKNVLICDTQPVAVEGMKWLIENSGDLQFAGSVPTLEAAYYLLNPGAAIVAAELAALDAAMNAAALHAAAMNDADVAAATNAAMIEAEAIEAAASADGDTGAVETCLVEDCGIEAGPVELAAGITGITDDPPLFAEVLALEPEPALEEMPEAALEAIFAPPEPPPIPVPIDAIVVDKGFGMNEVMELLHKLAATSNPAPAVVWGAAISEAEALRLLQAGARGILRRTSESGTLLVCLRAVTSGGTWMEDGIFGSTDKLYNPRRSQLTHREREVVVLVEKGLRNRDIAHMLGIQTGTVKIHLKHIFEKTGVRGRYGLALTGLQNKGSITLSPPQLIV